MPIADALTGGVHLLGHVVVPCILAMGVTLLAVPCVRRVAVAYELYDRPDAGLKPHERPVPYLGGVGIWLGWLAVVLWGIGVWGLGIGDEGRRSMGGSLAWLAVGGSVLMLVGLIDDIRHLAPKVRLLIQIAVAGLLVQAGIGRGVWQSLTEPLGIGAWDSSTGGVATAGLDAVFCILVLTGATNSTNLIDGLDGLCAGIVSIAALGFVVMAVLLGEGMANSQSSIHPAHALQIILAAGAVGACAGFLRYNFHPASMFMGNGGSLLLGYNVAVVLILLTEQASWRGLAGGLVVFGFPIFDTALAIARRWLNGKPLFVGDRSHFYDQLCDRGLSVRRTAFLCWLIGALFAVLGIVLMFVPAAGAVAIVLACPAIAGVACCRWGMLRVDDAAARSMEGNQRPS